VIFPIIYGVCFGNDLIFFGVVCYFLLVLFPFVSFTANS